MHLMDLILAGKWRFAKGKQLLSVKKINIAFCVAALIKMSHYFLGTFVAHPAIHQIHSFCTMSMSQPHCHAWG